ncbi:MAG: dual specificity protein phosphatase family protein [Blastocatellia bacterium]|nr:dual specificity protein phosphatase family protein [Blastocatellia bacterium]
MDVVLVNESGNLFLSPDIDDWETIAALDITVIIDLDGDLDIGIPTLPNRMLYLYFPMYDEDLPDLPKLHAVAQLGATLIEQGHKVLCHCLMGFNRSALVAGLILVHLGMSGEEVVTHLQSKRAGALYNETFARYLQSLPAMTRAA